MEQSELLKSLNRSSSLSEIQEYIKKVIDMRGFGEQPTENTMLLLLEEVGELAKAIRKDIKNTSVDENKLKSYDTVQNEVADVFIVLLSVCNRLGIDLFDSLIEKENINVNRKWKYN